MKTIAYNPQRRILTVLEDGYAVISFSGGIAERKLMEALGSGVEICIVDDSCRMKLRPADLGKFLSELTEAATQRVVVKRKG